MRLMIRNHMHNNQERIRYLYESLNKLNDTLQKLIPTASEIARTLTDNEKDRYYMEMKTMIQSLITELKTTNLQLKQLQNNTGLIRLALDGGADTLLSNLCESIDGITSTLEGICNSGGGHNGKK